ncbi:MAG TPA: dihydroneopterin aldolase [Candidatus Marinimicrobia bacterium]|jgi:dihydroneopterin aldolase|nr:dihydroneopterin aldolase [Candidatus Neomarinimicrobiota bacterium]MDP7217662.1 dihydroneopterin aldolase [Candidatus Neomarinimicrobiota bacterium]MDP7436650.1 dihydroneopterin aldolase [Candidatus Neomarinimicrobiota bacterium]MDP7653727.1 dihydroneopterin aldolase [Candidatus Neomarinimicrobiota bacterium]HBN45741.1 dihydroneopterin aldolase [Candidatus Neomarinimicrobiota bacterium]|tara:strand:+ start:634 stop:1002 length:369 start_codon:yes stop_codon:yes gene_type:complete
MGIIRLKNMQFYGYHGVSESEKHLGGKFEVDVEMSMDLKEACAADNLDATVDYEAVYNIVDGCVKNDKFYLIEALADSIARETFTHFAIAEITVRVRKPHAPINGMLDTVEVEISRNREDYA